MSENPYLESFTTSNTISHPHTCRDCGKPFYSNYEGEQSRCYLCRKVFADKTLAFFEKLEAEACKSCLNHFSCYKQKRNGELTKNHRKCSKMTFERKMELIGGLCYYHPTLNPKGFKPHKHTKEVKQ
jgi:hypothetical protein